MSEENKSYKQIIIEELKKEGVEIAEDCAERAVKGLFNATKAIVRATPNTVDDMAIPLIEIIEPKILKIVDKIDGKEG